MTKKERPHADVIRQWLDDPDAVVECRHSPSLGWIEADQPTWAWNREYRIRPAPKKKVVLYQWLMKGGEGYYATVPMENRPLFTQGIIRRLDHTRIEVEED